MRLSKEQIHSDAATQPPSHENPRCETCGLCRSTYNPFVFPMINGSTVFLISTPTQDDEVAHTLGNGFEASVILNHICKPLMIKDVSIFSATLCRPPDRRGRKVDPLKRQIDMCRPFVNHLLHRVPRPRKIIAMGGVAASMILNRPVTIKEEVGYVHASNFGNVTVTYSPSVLLQENPNEGGMQIGYLTMIREHVRRFILDLPHVEFPPMEVV